MRRLLDLRRFDAYRAAHPETKLVGSGYYYPIGANRGYVGLASDPALLVAVNKALSDLQGAGTIAELGRAAGLTYLAAPRADHSRRCLDEDSSEVTADKRLRRVPRLSRQRRSRKTGMLFG